MARATALLVAAIMIAACGSPAPSPIDPGDLEVWNGLRDELLVIVGGRPFRAAPCRVSAFESVELRGVRLASTDGVVVAAFRADLNSVPIGPRRYLLVGPEFMFQEGRTVVSDLRTRPTVAEPDGRTCQLTIEDLLNPPDQAEPPLPGRNLVP